MLEVVLRDVPGLLTPAEARQQRTEQSSLLAAFQRACDEAPDSAQGKKAALKLSAEKRLNDQSAELRHLMEELFLSKENASAEFEAVVSQMQDLTSRLESAEALAESERNQRELSESITAAAEKRIQELEEVLVDVETTSSKTLKQKQKNVKLQARIKALDGELAAVEIEVEKEREKQQQFIDDVQSALERISFLEKELKDSETFLEMIQVQRAEEQAERSQLAKNFEEAERRIKALDTGLKNAEERVALHEQAAKASEDIHTQLAEIEQELKDLLDQNGALEETLAIANQQNERLMESLQIAEKAVSDKARDEAQVITLVEQNELLVNEIKVLRDEYDQECSIRIRLEKGAAEDDRRIQKLEDSLAKVPPKKSETTSAEKDSEEGTQELFALRDELQALHQQFKSEQKCREGLESEVGEAHKLIGSLEKIIREAEDPVTDKRCHVPPQESENQKVQELEKKLRVVENQLEHERLEQRKLIKAVVVAENKLAEQEELLARGQVEPLERKIRETAIVETVTQSYEKPVKLMPHDLRPAPKIGVLFQPDWALEGLPCRSPKQVFKAWEAVSNVQTSLEGYPSQYCMAFLVVLLLKKEKKLYMLYRLKLNKHTLVCVPAKAPQDEASLKKCIQDGLSFLKRSGFEMDEMIDENIDSTLRSYFLEG